MNVDNKCIGGVVAQYQSVQSVGSKVNQMQIDLSEA